jgi:hypothetical protein
MTQISVPDILAQHPLVARLTRLRGRVRTVVALHGLGIIVAAGVAGLFGFMLLDYLMHVPAGMRLAMLAAGLVGLGLLVWRVLILPLTTRLTDQFLASRVENQNRHLADELMSAVNFIHNRAALTNALAARHIDMAAQKTAGIRFEDALNFRETARSLGLAALVLVLVAVVGLTNPTLAGIALQRWLTSADPAWPRVTNVALIWSTADGKAPRVIPMGEKITVRAMVDKGGRPRVWLTSRTDKTPSDTQLMTFQKEQSTDRVFYYESALEPDGRELFLRVEAGDDRDVPPVTIQMAPRPVITQMQAMIHAPAYARDVIDPSQPAPSLAVNLQNQAGRATQGATVDLQVKASKRFQVNAQGEPDVGLYEQNRDEPLALELTRRLLSSTEARLTFTADKTMQCRLLMHDTDGFQNRISGTVSLEVATDALPALVITEPRRSVERAPNGEVDITLQGTDDWGFDGLRLRADDFAARPDAPPAFATELPWQDLTADAAAGNVSGKTKYLWDLAPLKLEPGARLTFYGMVKDNYLNGSQTHDWVKSSPLLLEIRSASEIQETQRKALSDLNDRIKSLRIQQEQTRAQTDAINRIVSAAGAISPEQQAQLTNLAQQETQEAATASAIQQRAGQIAEELRQNKMPEGDLGKMAQDVAAGMRDVGEQNMPRAAADLAKAGATSRPAGSSNQGNSPSGQNARQSAQSMTSAAQQQGEAIAKMDDLIRKLGAIGDFESLRNETVRLLGQQKELAKETQQLAPKTVGQQREKLPPDVRNGEDKLAADQRALADKTADLLDRMERASASMNQNDPASAQSLQNAANAGRSSQVSGSQKSASNQLSSNQVSEASNSQQAAQQGLQQMMDELNKNELRKLEQLAREVRRLIDEVKKLRDDEDALNKETVAAGAEAAKAAIDKLANRQGTLQQNTIITEKKAENTQGAAQAAAFIHEGSDHMEKAAAALFSNRQPDATKPQTDAVAALDNALAELKKLQNQVQPELKNKQLAEFIKQYEEIKKDQVAVKGTSDDLETKRLAAVDKELDRQDELKVGGLAKTQSGLMDRVETLNKDPDLGQVDVVVWMNQQVTEVMSVSKTRLEKLQLGKQTASAQQAAIDRLQLIIDALREEQARPPEFNGGSGGGGGGGGGKPPLVPPMAQLKLLKAMQIVVNDQTKSVDANLKAAASDADRNQYQTEAQNLGAKEGRIHDMTKDIVDQLLQNQQNSPRPPQPAGGN